MRKEKWKYCNKINFICENIYSINSYTNRNAIQPMLEYNGKIVYCSDVIENVYTDYTHGFDDYEENIDYYTDFGYDSDNLFYEYCKHTEKAEESIQFYFNEAPDMADRLKKTKDGYIIT